MTNLLSYPTEAEWCDDNISNFDEAVIRPGIDDALRGGKIVEHAAWEYYGIVWFENGRFHEMVKRYGVHIDTVSASTLEELISETIDRYGSE